MEEPAAGLWNQDRSSSPCRVGGEGHGSSIASPNAMWMGRMLSVGRGLCEDKDLNQINKPPLDLKPVASSPSEVPQHWPGSENISQVTATKKREVERRG